MNIRHLVIAAIACGTATPLKAATACKNGNIHGVPWRCLNKQALLEDLTRGDEFALPLDFETYGETFTVRCADATWFNSEGKLMVSCALFRVPK